MKQTRSILSIAAACLLLTVPALPQAADNTKVNKSTAPTADDQGSDPADRELAAKIRRAITDDKILSVYAHNVKVIVNSGSVTLRGPVRTNAEKDAVGAKAISIAGAPKVTNEITIAPAD